MIISSCAAIDLFGAAAVICVGIGSAVAEEDQILGGCLAHLAHAKAVSAKHKAAVDVGAAAVCNGIDVVLDGLQVACILDVHPVAYLISVLVKLYNGNVNAAGVCLGEAVKEAAVLGEDLLDGFQAGVVAAAAATAILSTIVHGRGIVYNQLDSRGCGDNGLRGLNCEGYLKLVNTDLFDRFGESEAVLGNGVLGGNAQIALRAYDIGAVHYLVLVAVNCQGAHGEHTDEHGQHQQYGQNLAAHLLVLLCHNFFSFQI